MFSQPATLELTHNWGTESNSNFKGYHSGNDEPKGYGVLHSLQMMCSSAILELLDANSLYYNVW